MLVGYVVKLLAVVALYWYMYTENRRRDRLAAVDGAASDEERREAMELGMHDVTEIDNKGFRYAL